jgi:hypothetical protein
VHNLSSSFVLGYHGCDASIAEKLIDGEKFKKSNNDYDWLGPGIYFWEANPRRGLDFARECAYRKSGSIKTPTVIGAVVDLGHCLDLTTSAGIELVSEAYNSLVQVSKAASLPLPTNSANLLRRNLDCAVIRRVHTILDKMGGSPVDSVKGVFTEGKAIYPGAGFYRKTHIQIAVCNPECIKGVFRVPPSQLKIF